MSVVWRTPTYIYFSGLQLSLLCSISVSRQPQIFLYKWPMYHRKSWYFCISACVSKPTQMADVRGIFLVSHDATASCHHTCHHSLADLKLPAKGALFQISECWLTNFWQPSSNWMKWVLNNCYIYDLMQQFIIIITMIMIKTTVAIILQIHSIVNRCLCKLPTLCCSFTPDINLRVGDGDSFISRLEV